MKKSIKISDKEWELISALRNYRNSRNSVSIQFELYIDQLVDYLKETDED